MTDRIFAPLDKLQSKKFEVWGRFSSSSMYLVVRPQASWDLYPTVEPVPPASSAVLVSGQHQTECLAPSTWAESSLKPSAPLPPSIVLDSVCRREVPIISSVSWCSVPSSLRQVSFIRTPSAGVANCTSTVFMLSNMSMRWLLCDYWTRTWKPCTCRDPGLGVYPPVWMWPSSELLYVSRASWWDFVTVYVLRSSDSGAALGHHGQGQRLFGYVSNPKSGPTCLCLNSRCVHGYLEWPSLNGRGSEDYTFGHCFRAHTDTMLDIGSEDSGERRRSWKFSENRSISRCPRPKFRGMRNIALTYLKGQWRDEGSSEGGSSQGVRGDMIWRVWGASQWHTHGGGKRRS